MTGTHPPASGAIAAPRPKRPPLDRSTKVGAAVAGAVSFTLLTIGFVLFWVPILLGAVALILTTIVRFASRIDAEPDAGFRQFARTVGVLDLEAWAVPLVLVSVVGLAVMVIAVFSGKWILAGRRIERPWAITWAGLGVAVVAYSVVGGILSSAVDVVSSFAQVGSSDRDTVYVSDGGDLGDAVPVIVAAGVISVLVSIVVTAAIGWLAMWWMAYVLRPTVARAVDPDAVGASYSPAPGQPASGQAAPGERAPVQPASGERASGQSAPGERASGQSASGERAPGQAAPGQATSGT